MGGDPTGSKDCFENLMAICRSCDTKFGDKKQYKPMLYKVHAERFPNILYYDEDAEVAKML